MNETFQKAAEAYLEHLKAEGKSERTLYTYAKDFEQMEAFFGADRELAKILPPHVGRFLKSDELLKLTNGGERAKPTVDKTQRVMRMFFVWCVDTGRLKKLPLPKSTPMGRSLQAEVERGSRRSRKVRPDCTDLADQLVKKTGEQGSRTAA